MLLMENNSEAFLLADPISEHSSSPLLFFIGHLHGNKSSVSQLLISSCCLPFLNRRQTFQRGCSQANSLEWQKNRAHEHLPEPECQYQARDIPCAQTASHSFGDESCWVHRKSSLGDLQSIFHEKQVSYFKTMLRRSSCVGCNINHQSGKALLAQGTPKVSTDMRHHQYETQAPLKKPTQQLWQVQILLLPLNLPVIFALL